MARNVRPEQDTDEGFLRRWVRRKSGRDEEPEYSAREPAPPDAAAPAADPERQEPPPKSDADMPPLESIGPGSDISDFFSSGVSEALRNQALRRLFHLPGYNVTDGLDDYAENYNNFEALGDVMTADRRHREEVEKARAAEARSDDEREPAEAAVDDQDPDAQDSEDGGDQERDDPEAGGRNVAKNGSRDTGENRMNTTTDPDDRDAEV